MQAIVRADAPLFTCIAKWIRHRLQKIRSTNRLVVVESHLSNCHVSLFLRGGSPLIQHQVYHPYLQVVCRGIYDYDIVLLISYETSECVSHHGRKSRTLDGVGLDQLSTVDEKCLWDGLPFHALWHTQIYMRRRQLVDVEPNIPGPCIFDQVLV